MDTPGPVIERREDDDVAELAQIDQVLGDLVEAVEAELPAGPELEGEAETVVVGAFRAGRESANPKIRLSRGALDAV
jgi:hypothetical protein